MSFSLLTTGGTSAARNGLTTPANRNSLPTPGVGRHYHPTLRDSRKSPARSKWQYAIPTDDHPDWCLQRTTVTAPDSQRWASRQKKKRNSASTSADGSVGPPPRPRQHDTNELKPRCRRTLQKPQIPQTQPDCDRNPPPAPEHHHSDESKWPCPEPLEETGYRTQVK